MHFAKAVGLVALACLPATANAAIDPAVARAPIALTPEPLAGSGVVHECENGSDVLRRLVGCSVLIKSGASGEALSRAYRYRGAAYLSLGEGGRAINDFDQALQHDPTNATLYYVRGNAWQRLGEPERAIGDLDKAIRFDPGNAAAYADRGVAWEKLGDEGRALADYRRALDLDPENAVTLTNRANLLARMGEAARAAEDLDHAISIDPGYAAAYYNRASVRCEAGLTEPAIADYLKAISLGVRERKTIQEFLVDEGYYQPGSNKPLDAAVRNWSDAACAAPAPTEEARGNAVR